MPWFDAAVLSLPWLGAAVLALGVVLTVAAVRNRRGLGRAVAVLRVAGAAALVAVGLAVLGMAVVTAPMRASLGARGGLAPGLVYTAADGARASLGELGGDVLVVNLWATWCAPCVQEMPELERLQTRYGDRVSVVALSNEDPATVAAFLARRPVALRVGTVGDSLPEPYASGYGALPTTFVLDRERVVRETLVGGSTVEAFDAAVRPLLDAGL